MKNVLPLLITLLLSSLLFGQSGQPVFGKMLDETGERIPFAVVQAFSLPDSSFLQGAITDETGMFKLELTNGDYYIQGGSMGFETVQSEPFSVSSSPVRLPAITLPTAMNELEAVEISGEQTFVVNKIDRKAYNVDEIVGYESNNTLEVMEQIPSLQIDMDGVISLRGSENVTILIDGRPSVMSKTELEAYLQGLPADAIERIEVITNPSAKYDPDGMTGMINIVMKKQKEKTQFGTVTAGVNSLGGYNGSFMYNLGGEKFSWTTNLSTMKRIRNGNGFNTRSEYRDSLDYFLDQSETEEGYNLMNSWSNRFTYNLSESSELNASIMLNQRGRYEEEFIHSESYFENGVYDSIYSRLAVQDNMGSVIDGNLGWDKKFKDKSELNVSGKLSKRMGDGLSTFAIEDQIVDLPLMGEATEKNESDDESTMYLFQADYSRPITKKWSMESGLKTQVRSATTNSDYSILTDGEYVINPLLSQDFTLDEGINAAYGIGSYSHGSWAAQVGVRLESAYTDVIVPDSAENWRNEYTNLFPTGHLSYWINDENQLKASYSKRVNRPRGRQLNPVIDFSDPQNLRQGNPYLLPEFIDSYEIEYIKYWGNSFFNASLYYKDVSNQISRVKTVEDGVSLTTYTNFGSSTLTGIDLGLKIDITKWWELNWSGNGYYSVLNSDEEDSEFNNEGFQWSQKATNTFKVNETLTFQAATQYRSKRILAQGFMAPMTRTDLSARMRIMQGNGTVSLKYTDVFNSYDFEFETSGDNFDQLSYRDRQFNYLQLSFMYTFGNRKGVQRRSREGREGMSGDEPELD